MLMWNSSLIERLYVWLQPVVTTWCKLITHVLCHQAV